MPACASSGVYAPRDTHRCDAAVLVRHHVARFLERVEEGSHGPLPDFVQAELRAFAVCGEFSQGFVRTACRRCGDELRVPFPCKGRGFCPSCMGRRMAEGAALLVDHVLPEAERARRCRGRLRAPSRRRPVAGAGQGGEVAHHR